MRRTRRWPRRRAGRRRGSVRWAFQGAGWFVQKSFFSNKSNFLKKIFAARQSEVKAAAQDGGACDLVISNYALSELSVSLQWAYAERLVFDARRVYATVNFHHKHEAGNFGAVMGELEGRGYEVDQYAEVPQTDEQRRNTVVVAVAPPAEADGGPADGGPADGGGRRRRPGPADGGPAAEPAAAGMSVSQLREMRRKNKARLRALAAEEA